MNWKVVYTDQARADAKMLSASYLRAKAEAILDILREDPRQVFPPFENLTGDLSGAFSRRISILHRIVYEIIDSDKTVKVLRMWTRHNDKASQSTFSHLLDEAADISL